MTDSSVIAVIKYPLAYNPILEYWEAIESGQVVVGDKICRTYKKIVFDLTDNTGLYYYSPARANHIIEFIENYCRHSKGKMGGKPVILELWEKAMLATVFGFIDIEGNRKYNESLLIVGKKNGKSLLASCVGLYLLVGDSEPGPEIYAVASKRDQAKIIWQEAKRMVRKSPALRKRIKALVAELNSEDFNDGVFKPLASDSDTLDGLNIHGGMMDEIHQWKNGKALYDIIADGVSAREQALIFMTSTAGTIREDIYDEKYEEAEIIINGYFDPEGYKDEHFIAFIYELDSRKEWMDPATYKKANPGLGTIKNEKTLLAKVEKAKANPMLVKNLVCKEFNIRETSTDKWLTFEEVDNRDTFDIEELRGCYGIGGDDLSATTDLTHACILIMKPGSDKIYVIGQAFMPGDTIEQRSKEDKVPYDKWADRGFITPCSGNKVDYRDVTDWYIRIKDELGIIAYWNGYDSWNAPAWVEDMENRMGYKNKESLLPVIMGAKTLSAPMKLLGADLASKKINYNNNPLMKWALTNVAIETDKNENIRPIKGKHQRQRIDPAVALLIAYTVLQNNLEDYKGLIGW